MPEESLATPSSMTPLSLELACHRCKVLSLDCIVWDGDRKRRPKVSLSSGQDDHAAAYTRSNPDPSSSRLPSSPPRSPGSLEQLAAAAARLSDQRHSYHSYRDASDASPLATSLSNDATSARGDAASTLASVQFFNPITDDAATPSSVQSPASQRTCDRPHMRSASTSRHNAQSPCQAHPSTPGSTAFTTFRASSAPSCSSASSKAQPPGRTWTSLWRPLSVLIDYAAQQPSFTTYLLGRIDRSLTDLDILDLIPRQTLSYLKPFLKPYLLWHPHLPGLDQMYTDHCKRPTVSSALLLSSMCLVACRHAMPLTDPLPTKLSTLVDQLGTQILLSAPRDMYTVQALELLLAHEPSLVGTSVAGSAQAERANGLLGESLLAAALTIARALDLDKAIDNVIDICRQLQPKDRKEAQIRRDVLIKHMAGASIWVSLRIWEGHFSFVNSTVRPIDLDDITAKAEAIVAIDNDGKKIERMQRDPFQSTEQRFPGHDEDSILRSAGRTGLVYRLRAMSRFQDTIAGMYRILASAPKPSPKPDPDSSATLTPTTPQTRQQMLDLLDSSSRKQLVWQAAKAQAFSPFASVRPALLLEDWATMESYSLEELLPCLAICAFMTGELNHGFSANEMVEALVHDSSFQKHSSTISDIRDNQTQLMLSVFHLFDRGLGYSQPDILNRASAQTHKQRGSLWIEATGAPLLLTTAFATEGCKSFLEKTACSLHGFDFLTVTADMHIVMMINTLNRLEECDRNEYLPPIRAKKTNMPPPSRSLPSLTPDLTDSKNQASPGRSISQIGVLFIQEMVQVMQKWKLGASLQRTVPLHFRDILGSGKAPAATAQGDKFQHASAEASEPNEQSSKPNAPSRKTQVTGRQNAATSSLAADSAGNGTLHAHPEGSLSQAQSFAQNFQTRFISGLPQQSTASGATVTGNGGHGGMFDIPIFDLFGPASTIDWTNNVPWFDPVESVASGPELATSLPSFANGEPTSQWATYQAPSCTHSSWSATSPRKRSVGTLPPLQHATMHYMPPAPPSQSHAYNGGYAAYSLPSPSSITNPGGGYGEAQAGGYAQSHVHSLSSNGAHHRHQPQQAYPHLHSHSHPHPHEHQLHQHPNQHQHEHHRACHDGGGNSLSATHHGAR